MDFSFKKFIPKVMQDTKWGDLAEVWQYIWNSIKTEKIYPIVNQKDIDLASIDELKNILTQYGFKYLSLDGYTSTKDYIYKEVKVCVPKIKTKTTQTSFVYVGIPFNLISTAYTIIYETSLLKFIVDETLQGVTIQATTELDRESLNILYYESSNYFDRGLFFDQNPIINSEEKVEVISPSVLLSPAYLDSEMFPQLDGSANLYSLSRNICYSYIYKFVETSAEFMTIETLKALENDVNQVKRITDRVYYEPSLFIDLNTNFSLTTKIWFSYDGSFSVNQENILINSFSHLSKIRFGNGKHLSVNSSITDVDNFLFEIVIANTNILIDTDSVFSLRALITELQKFQAFTEIAVLDIYGNCILYSTFPKVQWIDTMYNNIKLTFNLI